ncbi:hypothetical protein evm_009576 [Chilo suppressalis]|nr:hypothetical protein evm_009576 [Chilo suppressalis]
MTAINSLYALYHFDIDGADVIIILIFKTQTGHAMWNFITNSHYVVKKKNLKQLRPDCHVVQYRIVLGNKAAAADLTQRPSTGHEPNLEEFLNTLYNRSGAAPPPADDCKRRRAKKQKP